MPTNLWSEQLKFAVRGHGISYTSTHKDRVCYISPLQSISFSL